MRPTVPSFVLNQFSITYTPKQKTKGLSIIIPIRGIERNINLNIIIPYIIAQNIEPLEIFIIEEDTIPKIDVKDLIRNPIVTHKFLKSDKPFNKSRVINAGVFYSNYNKICMIDVDMIIEKGLLYKIYTILETYDVCFSIKEIYFLTEIPSPSTYYHDGKTWFNTASFACHGGIVSFNKKAFLEIGGMDEKFVGHGSEDTEFYERAKQLLRCQDTRFATVLHIPHPRDLAEAEQNHTRYEEVKKQPLDQIVKKLKAEYQTTWK